MDLYDVSSDQHPRHSASKRLGEGDCVWQQGKPGCYDNLVHKVSSADTEGFTLHLFSENPALGQLF